MYRTDGKVYVPTQYGTPKLDHDNDPWLQQIQQDGKNTAVRDLKLWKE